MAANVVETWSHTEVEVVKVRHTWTISNFSYCTEKSGQLLTSETFSATAKDKINWRLDLYPRGVESVDKDFVIIFLRLMPCDKAEIRAKGKIVFYNDKIEELEIFSIDDVFNQDNQGCGFSMERNLLFDDANGLLDGKLTILCELAFARDTVNVPTNGSSLQLKDPACSLREDLELLLDTQNFSDVTLIAGGREFRVHKTILAARSAVFSAMFEHEMEERKHNRVNIIDMDNKVVEEMLRFIYTGKVPNIEKVADSLLVAADKYALDSLKFMCQRPLFESLSIENAAHTLVPADIHSCDWLKTQTVNFINKHTNAVMDTKDFKLMVTSHPYLIADILRATAIKRNGDVDELILSAVNKDLSQTHI